MDARTLLRFASLPDLRSFVFEPRDPKLCTFTAADVAEFRRLRPDVRLKVALGDKIIEHPALANWPGKDEGDGSLTPWKLPKDAPPPAIVPFSPDEAKKHQDAWAASLKQPVEIENKLGMKFRLIPPGEFDTTFPGIS